MLAPKICISKIELQNASLCYYSLLEFAPLQLAWSVTMTCVGREMSKSIKANSSLGWIKKNRFKKIIFSCFFLNRFKKYI
jgi:hypothetical protein